jgi:hypothetical protein
MYRIKDIEKIKMNDGNVLIKIHKKESKIILPNEDSNDSPHVDHAEVIAIASDITDLKKGDIIMEFKTVYGFEWNEENYAVVHRLSIGIAFDKINFNIKKAKPSPKIQA